MLHSALAALVRYYTQNRQLLKNRLEPLGVESLSNDTFQNLIERPQIPKFDLRNSVIAATLFSLKYFK